MIHVKVIHIYIYVYIHRLLINLAWFKFKFNM